MQWLNQKGNYFSYTTDTDVGGSLWPVLSLHSVFLFSLPSSALKHLYLCLLPHELLHLHSAKVKERGNGKSSTSIIFTLIKGKNSIYRHLYIAFPLGLTIQDSIKWPCLEVRGAGKANIFNWAHCCPELNQGLASKKEGNGCSMGNYSNCLMATMKFRVNGDPWKRFTIVSCECEASLITQITSSLQVYFPFLCYSCRRNSAIWFTYLIYSYFHRRLGIN